MNMNLTFSGEADLQKTLTVSGDSENYTSKFRDTFEVWSETLLTLSEILHQMPLKRFEKVEMRPKDVTVSNTGKVDLSIALY